jgi:DNA replication protein DnaC
MSQPGTEAKICRRCRAKYYEPSSRRGVCRLCVYLEKNPPKVARQEHLPRPAATMTPEPMTPAEPAEPITAAPTVTCATCGKPSPWLGPEGVCAACDDPSGTKQPAPAPPPPAASCRKCGRTDRVYDGLCWPCRDQEHRARVAAEEEARRAEVERRAQAQRAERERIRAIEDLNDRRAMSGVSRRHSRFLTWDSLEGTPAYAKAFAILRSFVEGRNADGILAVIGGRGNGKTQACSIAVWQCIEAGGTARITTGIDLYCGLKAMWKRQDDADEAWLREWSAVDLLVIDEIGEISGDHMAVMLTALIDHRYRDGRKTIIAGNVSAADFSTVVGASIASRCIEGDGGLLLFEGWPSFRRPTSELDRQAAEVF